MIRPNIDFINRSTVVTDAGALKVMNALQKQVDLHFGPKWGTGAILHFVGKTAKGNPSNWQLIILDNSDVAGALGYHDLTASGKAIGKIFAKTDLDYNLAWSVTASHELLEMLGDPYVNLTAQISDTQFYAYESCDACESDDQGYLIDGVLVSDFVYPAWFIPGAQAPYDYKKLIKRPLQLLDGGYISVWEANSGWQQLYGQKATRKYTDRAPIGSRRERRRTPQSQWMVSTAS